MARIRTIKPEFWSDKKVASWPLFTRLLYIGLWTSADDHGRGSAEQARVAAELFPYDLSRDPSETLARVAAGFETLAAEGRVTLYEVRGELFYEVARWKDHQRVDNAGKPRFPTPLDQDARPYRDSRETCGEKPLEQGTGNRDQGTGKESPNGDSCPEVCDPQTPDEKIDEGSVVMVFQTNGNPKTWKLRSTRVEGWKKAYPGVDIDAELLKAEAWLQDNPSRRKTASGMPRFLGSWMSRRQNSGSVGQKGSSKPTEKTWFQRYLDGEVSVDGPMEEAG